MNKMKINQRKIVSSLTKEEKNEIETRPMFYPASVHECLKKYKQVEFGNETNSSILNRECLLLPSYPSLTKQDLEHIISTVKKYTLNERKK